MLIHTVLINANSIITLASLGIVRVGGQSREERLRDYNLRHLRERQRKSEFEDPILKRERGTVWREKKDIERNTNLVQASQLLRESHKGVLSTSILAKFMEQRHLECLQNPPNDPKVDDDGKLLMWLGVERKYDESHSHSGTTYHNEDFRRMVDPRVFMEDEDEDAGEDGVFKGASCAASIKKKPVICYPDQTKHPADLYKSIESNKKMERNEETSVSYLYSLVREDR